MSTEGPGRRPGPPAPGQPARTHDLHVGPITRTQIVRFAGAGGDFNPMHHDEPFAQSAEQPSVFAMGQLSAALLARLARDWVGDARMRWLSVRFTAQVWPATSSISMGRSSSSASPMTARRAGIAR